MSWYLRNWWHITILIFVKPCRYMLWNGLSSFYIIPYIILVLKSNRLHLYHFLSLFGDVGTIMCLGPSCLVLPILKYTFLFIVCTFISTIRDMIGHATRTQCSSLMKMGEDQFCGKVTLYTGRLLTWPTTMGNSCWRKIQGQPFDLVCNIP
jgi:hypothetical protein